MAKESNLDLKIIFLARDPRGIFSSRQKLYDQGLLKKGDLIKGDPEIKIWNRKMVADVCKHTKNFIDERNASPWLKD